MAGLAPGTCNSGPISVTLPAGVSGSFVLIAVADADHGVPELSETNNKTRSLTISP